jgi:hypothetical protein
MYIMENKNSFIFTQGEILHCLPKQHKSHLKYYVLFVLYCHVLARFMFSFVYGYTLDNNYQMHNRTLTADLTFYIHGHIFLKL